jgi:hypothetical protein
MFGESRRMPGKGLGIYICMERVQGPMERVQGVERGGERNVEWIEGCIEWVGDMDGYKEREGSVWRGG